MTSHYRTLGVDPEADPVVIRSAYLALMRRYHPDGGGAEADPARAKAVTAAWEVLRSPGRRAAYDETRQARFSPGEVRGGGMIVAGGPRVRGGAAGRNLFLALAVATGGLGWWALQQPHLTPPVKVAERPEVAPTSEPSVRTGPDDRASREREAAADIGARLPDVIRRDPVVEAPAVPPTQPVADPVRMPLRTAEAPQPARRNVAAQREHPTSGAAPIARPRAAATPSLAAVPEIDLAPLERHLQLLTDQSFRFGTEAKKARLMASREPFLTRLRTCESDSCKRDAYLRRNAEIGEIMRN